MAACAGVGSGPAGETQASVPGAGPAVGIIDDDVSSREALTGLVQSFGFAVVPFASAQAFLQAAGIGRFACLIVDVHMPQLDGPGLMARLADMGCGIPIVFVTAEADPAIRARAIAGGARGFLGKPFDPDALLRLLVSVVRPNRDGDC